ncbi:HAD family hydrolase [Streptomyces sp. NPDC021093]|uniref:HAD family hydrolase n=1 Tax=Streptomyces sp. NPDC021093 TaxID=3365112 RepID=UPI00378ECB9C
MNSEPFRAERSPARSAAFFDVDETLITTKSMFDFLEFHCALRGMPEAYGQAMDSLRNFAAAGGPREEVNRRYYRHYAGVAAAELADQGVLWFRRRLREAGLFHPPVLSAFRRHAQEGLDTVLVSGSFFACLDPVAAHIGATTVLATRPVVADGILTGEVERPMIGGAKAEAARALAGDLGYDLAASHAYGDHATDLGLLELVGRPTAVGDDPVLAERVRERGWSRLPGISGPVPLI